MVFSNTFTVAAATSALFALSAAQSNDTNNSADSNTSSNSTITCRDGAYIVTVRGSLEPQGLFGLLNPIKDEILAQIPNSQASSLTYPSTLNAYGDSQTEGVGNLTEVITRYVDACPDHKVVLLGYSQGAHVIGDTLIGAEYIGLPIFPERAGIDQKYVDSVAAVIMMGDPANIADQSFLVGNSTRNGTFPRTNAAQWASRGLAEKVQSYCDANDTFCDSGSSVIVHVGYVPEYGSDAASFVVEKWNAAAGTNATNDTNSTGGSGTPGGIINGTDNSGGSGAPGTGANTTTNGGANPTGTAGPTPTTNAAINLNAGYVSLVGAGLLQLVLGLIFTVGF